MNTTQILKEMKEHGIYDAIACNYYQMKKEELAEVIKELDYKLYTIALNEATYKKNANDVIKELEIMWKEEEE